MPDCTTALNCCPGDNSFNYELAGSALLNVVTAASPADGGTTTGDGQYALGAEVTVVATPQVPTTIDVGVDFVLAVDESGGNTNARILLNAMLPGLDAALQAAGIGSGTVANRYGLVGFGSMSGGTHGPTDYVGHTHFALGDFAGFLATIDQLATDPAGGPIEDNYEAISYANANMVWRETRAVAKVLAVIADEDRNVHHYTSGGASQAQQFEALRAELVLTGVHLVAIISWTNPQDSLGNAIMGYSVTPDKTWRADGSGGYTNGIGGVMTDEANTDPTFPTGLRSETGDLALHESLQGQMWDYQFFRVAIGTCDTNGTTVTRVSGNSFTFWGPVPGGTMTINYVDYIIDTVDPGGDIITLTTSAGVQTGVDWSFPRDERDSFIAALVQSLDDSISTIVSWQFDGWYNSGGELLSTNASYTFNILNNATLEARFSFEDT